VRVREGQVITREIGAPERNAPPFDKPRASRIAVKVIDHLSDEVMKVFKA